MFKYLYVVFIVLSTNSCKLKKELLGSTTTESLPITLSTLEVAKKYVKNIDSVELKQQLYVFASDSMEGRATGTLGQKKAALFLKNAYKQLGISSPANIDYYQNIPKAFFNNRSDQDASNVVAYIKGKEFPEELVIISAHYDHLGLDKEGKVHNGADDDGSGTVAILQMAKAFKKATDDGYRPKRSILFLHVVGEEIGLYGSLSTELHQINNLVNEEFSKLKFDYRFNKKNDPNRFYYRSDHYNFAKNNIPVIFYFNGTHDDYHQITDTPDKIDYALLKKRAAHIFLTAWELANREQCISLD